jgi:Aspartyl/Asparaginyl beta-hydroxylase/Phytanoyl-CoA dioxygenase (PhyH)/L-proline 3-hydroxylase, C-terminal
MAQHTVLSAGGVPVASGDDPVGQMRSSNGLLGDDDALRARMADDGYLLLRGFLDRDAVLAARREILTKFAIVDEIDAIDHDVMDGIRSRHSAIDKVNLFALTESLRSGMAYGNVVEAPRLMSFFSSFLGGPVRSFDFRWPRLMRPGDYTGIHCDGPYITRGTRNVWSVWMPLGDVPMVEGALMVLEGSHRNEQLRASYGSLDADRDKMGWLSNDPVALQAELGGRWLSTDFEAGDVLIFGPYLVHGSLDNNSPEGRCRLSSDTRYQLVGDALDARWNGGNPNPHGGRPRVFLPGAGPRDENNRDFQDEWKDVDERGRLVVRRRPAATDGQQPARTNGQRPAATNGQRPTSSDGRPGRALRSCRLGSIPLDVAGVEADLAAVDATGYVDSYTEFVCGSWRTCMLWNASGDTSDNRIHDYAGRAQPTALGRELRNVAAIVEEHFDLDLLRFARLTRLGPGTVVLPHRDYIELESELYRVHVPLRTNDLAFASEEDTIYRMRRGEVWFLDATRPHSIANFSDESRIHLLLDFAVSPGRSPLHTGAAEPPGFPPDAVVPRRPLATGERAAFQALAGVVDRSNLMDVLAMVIRRYFVAELSVDDVFAWLVEIGAESGDDAVVDRARWLHEHCLTSR